MDTYEGGLANGHGLVDVNWDWRINPTHSLKQAIITIII